MLAAHGARSCRPASVMIGGTAGAGSAATG